MYVTSRSRTLNLGLVLPCKDVEPQLEGPEGPRCGAVNPDRTSAQQMQGVPGEDSPGYALLFHDGKVLSRRDGSANQSDPVHAIPH